MSADALLSKLSKVKKTGPGNWLACCPSHKDKNPSMTVRECDDGRVLLHCFAGCSVEEVIGAVGVGFDELFPPKPIAHAARIRKPFPAADVLEALASESAVVMLTASAVCRGEELTLQRRARLIQAVGRIQQGRDLANG